MHCKRKSSRYVQCSVRKRRLLRLTVLLLNVAFFQQCLSMDGSHHELPTAIRADPYGWFSIPDPLLALYWLAKKRVPEVQQKKILSVSDMEV